MHRLKKLPNRPFKMSDNPKIETATTENGTSLHRFTLPDVELALRIVALNGGNVNKSVAILETEYNLHITVATLNKYRKVSFPRLYTEIQNELRKKIGDSLSNQLIENAYFAADTTESIIARLSSEYEEIPTKELGKVAKELAGVSSQSIDKAQILRGMPNTIIEERNPEMIIEDLKRLGVKLPPKSVPNEAGEQDG